MAKPKSFAAFLKTKHAEYPGRFAAGLLDPRFVRFYESGERIRVKTCGQILTGTVGVTSGWMPVFILMPTRHSLGSRWTLGPKDQILGIKTRGRYLPPQET